jgi:hypothetical protein
MTEVGRALMTGVGVGGGCDGAVVSGLGLGVALAR